MTQTLEKEESRTRTFNPNEHVIQLKSKSGSSDYLPVQWRLVWFREMCPHGTIETVELEYDTEKECSVEAYVWNNETRRSEKIMKIAKGYARYRTVATDGKGGVATGTKSECAANFPDYGEKAETGSVGRALAHLGYGTQFAPELNEEHRIVDAPVDRTPENNNRKPLASVRPATGPQGGQQTGDVVKPSIHAQNTTTTSEQTPMATEQQISSIRKLSQHLGKPELENPENITYQTAREMISQLSTEYRESRKAS